MKYMLFLCAGIFLFACNNRQAVETLQTQTMAIHDEAMKEMADMARTGRALKQLRATMDTLPASKPRRDAIGTALTTIEKADADMMDWMQTYHAPDDKPVQEAIAYLNDQKQKMEKNLSDIRAANAAGKQLLK